MSIRHLFGREDVYLIHMERSDGKVAPWRHYGTWLHFPKGEAHAEWNVFAKRGFGYGFQAGRNGGESDIGLNVYCGRLFSLWLRLRSPWTGWARIPQERDPKHWYHARHYGIRVHPHDGCLISGEWGALDGMSNRSDPWWRQWSITKTTILGRYKSETLNGDSGVARIPLPEGIYLGTWTEKRHETRYVRWPGTWRDRLLGARHGRYVNLDIEGGIPVEGKGENSWDCGMDGIFGCSGPTLSEAIGNCVKSVLRDRERYGGPHNLDRPMTVKEAGARA